MIIKTNNKIFKQENIEIIPFIEYYYQNLESKIYFSAIPEDYGKRPDYYINNTETLVEVKEIHDRESNQKHAQWGKIITKLQKAVDSNKLLQQVKGTYLVNTPERFKTPTELKVFINASNEILKAIIDNKKEKEMFNVNFEINKVSDQENIVVFGSTGGGGFIDPANIVYQNIKDKIDTANKQLGNPPDKIKPVKRILLLVNKYYFPLWNWDLFKAISLSYKDLLIYKNIDEIWYQIQTKDNNFFHQLLYRKSFFEQFEKSIFTDIQKYDYELFVNWFSELSTIKGNNKSLLLNALRLFLKNNQPYKIFKDPQTRIEMVRFGLWLAEQEKLDDTVWFIKQFIHDPDPQEPKDYNGDEKYNLHKQVFNNEDSQVITTVLGHLAWVIQKLAVRKEYITLSLEFTQKLLKHKNLYIKLQALIPLIEISARRQWLEELDEKNDSQLYKEFRSTVFSVLRKYYKYKAIANSLTHVFYYFKDLNTKEALEVLNSLKHSREVAPLFIYFGIFRKRHYKNKGQFDPKPLKNELVKLIKNTDSTYTNLLDSIAWNFWKLLQENKEEFDELKFFLDIYFDLPYQKSYFHSLERIIEDWVERKPEICVDWFIKSLNNISSYVKKDETIARNVWINPEKMLKFIAINKPQLLLDIVEKLTFFWKLGMFVGSPKEIFETYILIKDSELKIKIENKFKLWYEELKNINPKIEKVEWS